MNQKQETEFENYWPVIALLELELRKCETKAKLNAEFFISKEQHYGDWVAKFSKRIKD